MSRNVTRRPSGVRIGTIPASGTVSVSFQAPPIAGEVATFFLQPLFVNPPGSPGSPGYAGTEIVLGAPTQMHVLDPQF